VSSPRRLQRKVKPEREGRYNLRTYRLAFPYRRFKGREVAQRLEIRVWIPRRPTGKVEGRSNRTTFTEKRGKRRSRRVDLRRIRGCGRTEKNVQRFTAAPKEKGCFLSRIERKSGGEERPRLCQKNPERQAMNKKASLERREGNSSKLGSYLGGKQRGRRP